MSNNSVVLHVLSKLNWPAVEKAFGISALTFIIVLVTYTMDGQNLFVENPFVLEEKE